MGASHDVPIQTGVIGATLVTLEQFACFIREESYFDVECWDHGESPRAEGGDEILRRVGFTWGRRYEPVRGVTWYEAEAYCRRRGGRLPYFEEWETLRARMSGEGSERRSLSTFFGRSAHQLHRGGAAAERIPEWCRDWYRPFARGANVTPGRSPLRVVAGGNVPGVDPAHTGANAGFRVVLPTPETDRSRRSRPRG